MNHYTLTDIQETRLTDGDIDFSIYDKSKYNIFVDVREICNQNWIIDFADLIRSNLGDKAFLVTNTSVVGGIFPPNVVIIDYFKLQTYLYMQFQRTNKKWNYHAREMLFFGGKMYKYHRIGVLWTLVKNFHSKLEYSFFYEKLKSNYINDLMRDLDIEATYEEFAKEYARMSDIQPDQAQYPDGHNHFVGYPYDETVYNRTLFSIICETDITRPGHGETHSMPIVTEKTWKTIVNRHPAVLIADGEGVESLLRRGYEFLGADRYPLVGKCLTKDDAIGATNQVMSFLENNLDEIYYTAKKDYTRVMSITKKNYMEFVKECIGDLSNPLFDIVDPTSLIFFAAHRNADGTLFDK